MSFSLNKSIWTTEDFEEMGWHDNTIHGLSFDPVNFKVLFDIDYIFKWELDAEENTYSFWLAPATLIFENVYDLVFEIDSFNCRLEILNITRSNPSIQNINTRSNADTYWEWEFELVQGTIRLKASGFKQFIRKMPTFQKYQSFDLQYRGGTSFSEVYAF